MVKRTEIHIPIREIIKLSFSCEDCHAVITVDITEKGQRKGIGEKIDAKFCPACNCRFIRPVSEVLIALIDFHERATAGGVEKSDFHLVISEATDEAK